MTIAPDPAAPRALPPAPGMGRMVRHGLVAGLLALAAVQFWLVAWLSDDIMITLRQVERFTAGEGIVWNPGQRVQAFTHAAWFWILSAGTFALRPLHPEAMYLWTLAASALCWGGALWLWARLVLSRGWGLAATALALVLPLLPLAIRDYTSSGLETPLSFLLAMGVVTARGTALWTLMALAVLTRPDHALQFGPLALMLLATRDFRWRELATGTALILGWAAFATFYFGAPLPNTYYAKAGAGLGWDVRWAAYAGYWRDAAAHLPLTLGLLFGGLGVALWRGDRRARALAAGVALHLLYLAWIGGDFMRGRFLAVDTLLAMALAVRALPEAAARAAGIAALAVAIAAVRPWHAPIAPRAAGDHGVTDERGVYVGPWGLRSDRRQWPRTHPAGPAPAHAVRLCGMAGGTRLNHPDTIWVIDTCALTDPFLARLPAWRDGPRRPGHPRRLMPEGYHRMILEGAPPPPALAPLWADVRTASTGPLLAPGRAGAIWRLWRADYPHDPEAHAAGAPGLEEPVHGVLTPGAQPVWPWPESYGAPYGGARLAPL